MTPGRLARIVVRALTDWGAWRRAGRHEFAFMWRGISMFPGGRIAMHVVVGSLAILMLPVGLPMVWHPLGPPGPLRTGLYVAAIVAAVFLGVWWAVKRDHTFREAVTFIVLSDLLIVLGTVVLGAPASRICGTIYLGMIAMLVAFLLGWRALVLQALFAFAVITAYVAVSVVQDGVTVLDLYVYVAPAVTMEVGLPIIVQVLVEFGRMGMGKVFTERNRDPLTGLYNRQGLRAAQQDLLRRQRTGLCVVAIVDLDSFKAFNDAYGHLAGDDKLAETARRLRAGVDGALIARLGGDEFIVVAFRSSRYGADTVIRALRRLVTGSEDEPPEVTGSVGAVILEEPTRPAVEAAVADADAALYEAKRDRRVHIVVREASSHAVR